MRVTSRIDEARGQVPRFQQFLKFRKDDPNFNNKRSSLLCTPPMDARPAPKPLRPVLGVSVAPRTSCKTVRCWGTRSARRARNDRTQREPVLQGYRHRRTRGTLADNWPRCPSANDGRGSLHVGCQHQPLWGCPNDWERVTVNLHEFLHRARYVPGTWPI